MIHEHNSFSAVALRMHRVAYQARIKATVLRAVFVHLSENTASVRHQTREQRKNHTSLSLSQLGFIADVYQDDLIYSSKPLHIPLACLEGGTEDHILLFRWS